MIRIFLLLLSALAATWFIADTIKQKGPGYAYIYIDQYSIETSFWLLLGVLLIIAILLFFIINIGSYLVSLSFKTLQFSRQFGLTKSRKMHQVAVLAYLEGFWQKAHVDMHKALKKVEAPFIANLFIFHAHLKQGDTEAAKSALQQAQACKDYDELTLMLAQIDLLMAMDQSKELLASLKNLLRDFPLEPRVVSKAIHCYLCLGEIEAIEPLIKQAKKQKLLTIAQLQQWEFDFYQAKIHDAEDWKSLKKLWRSVHKLENDELSQCFFSHSLDKADASDLEKMLRQELKKNWHEELLFLYASISLSQINLQVEFLQRYTEQYKHSANLFLALALLEKKNQQAEKALEFVEQSLVNQPSTKAFALQAEIFAMQGNKERQLKSLQQALALD